MNNVPLEMPVKSHGLHLKERVQKAIARGVFRLDSWTRRFPSRSGHLNISKRDRDGVHRVELVLELPQKTIVAHDEVPNLVTAIDRVFRKATRQLREFKALLRRDHLHKDMRSLRQSGHSVTESEISAAAKKRDLDEFNAAAEQHVGRLQRYLKREVGVLRHRFPGVKFSVPDLVEEALAGALERFDDKPLSMPTNQWLYGVALDLIERQALHAQSDGMTGASRIEEEELAAPRDLVEDLLDEFLVDSEVREDRAEPINDSFEDHLAGSGPEDPAEAAERHDLEERVVKVMSELPTSWRRSFMLHFMEGFDFQEIAQIQNVTNDQIRFQVQSAELFLRERLAELAVKR